MPDEYEDPEYMADAEGEQQPELPMEEDKPKRVRKPTAQEKAAVATPIAQAGTDDTAYGKVHITRSLSLGSRNDTVHLGVELPIPLQPGWSLPMAAAATADVCAVVKTLVYSQLGLEFTIDEEGIIHEVVRTFPGTTEERGPRTREEARSDDDRRAEQRQERRDQYGGQRNGGGRFPHPADLERPDHVDREVWDDLVSHYDDWYDNRRDKDSGKYKSTAPDFKRAEDSETIWLTPFRREPQRGGRRN